MACHQSNVNRTGATMTETSPRNPITTGYRRFLIDIHTPDWDPRFLADFSADHLAAQVAGANAATITVPANNHVGLNFWPSSVGRGHRAMGDGDQLRDMLAAARAHGLSTVVYYAIAYVEWYWEQHPEARFVFADGEGRRLRLNRAGMAERFRVVCHNDPDYRAFVLTQVTELAEGYDADGFNIDMTMWPGPCYCATCRRRFRDEEGQELPLVVDWKDPVWRAFARRRALWLAEFAGVIADRVRSIRPDATVVHQSGPYFSDWWIGGSNELAAATDWLSADTYTTREGLSFALKLSNSLSAVKPAELINTWTAPAIFEHVVSRTADEMDAVASIAIAHDCALSVIDAVDPTGRIADPNYPMMRAIFADVARLEPHLGGEMLHDVEIYRSFRGAFDEAESGHPVTELRYPDEREEFTPSRTNHRAAAIHAGGALQAEQIPFGVVSRARLDGLDPAKVLVLANLQWLDPDELDAIHAFLDAGGRVYASGDSPLLDDARFGLRRVGRTHGIATYLAPTAETADLMAPFDARRPLTIHGPQEQVEAVGDATVLATITLPYILPGGERYASTLADPPGTPTTFPGLLEIPVGRGRLLYAAGVLEAEAHPTQRAVFVRLVRRLLGRTPRVTGRGPRSVEFTAFRRPEELVVFALNRQDGDETIPVRGVEVDVEADGVGAVRLLPDEVDIPFTAADGRVRFTLPEFRTRAVAAIRRV
jgi:hypothetical protein